MANRHLSRSIALQTLFEWDFNGKNNDSISSVLDRNIIEFASGSNDAVFMGNLVQGVVKKCSSLDNIISKAAPDWPLEKIANVDRNVLRIGLFELLFSDRNEVPPKVAINEAIELAKAFGGETSGKFVNGVLGAVYKELGEPGKDQESKKREEVPYEELSVERLCGAVVYAIEEDNIYLALVHDIFGRWTLSKGHITEDESEEEGVKRKIKEEIGIDINVKEKLGENEYVANDKTLPAGKKRKHVSYFLAESKFEDLKLEEGKGGLDDCKWFKITEILDLNFYDDILPIVTKAISILASQKK